MKIPDQIIPDIYEIAKQVYEKKVALSEGAETLSSKNKMNNTSARIYINDFKSLLAGQEFKRTLNAYSMEYFISRIGKDYGDAQFRLSVEALRKHIHYYESCHSGQMHGLRGIFEKLSGRDFY